MVAQPHLPWLRSGRPCYFAHDPTHFIEEIGRGMHSRICCRDLGQFAPNDKHSLEEQFWHLAFATSTDARVPLARPGWLASQASLPLHGFWRRTLRKFRWSWNVKSTVRKARFSRTQNQPGSSWENWWLPTTSQLHFFALHNLHLGPI